MRLPVVIIVMAAVLGATAAAAQDFTVQTVQDFTKYCTGCHDKSRTDIDKDTAWWNDTVEKMSTKYYMHFDAHMSVPEKTAIAHYLAAKSLFTATCGKCHGIDRPLAVTKDRDGWTATVARMSGNNEKKFGLQISAADQTAIVNYLAVTVGATGK